MKQKILLIFLITFFGCTKSKNVEAKSESKTEKFPPEGWKIIGSCTADFNGDKIIDKAYVIQENKKTISKECYSDDEPFYKKELIIQFGLPGGKYKTNLKTTKVFGACNWGIQGTDAFGEIGKRKNTLKLSFWTGGTLRTSLSYYFRYENNDWYLIGSDEIMYQVPSDDQYIKEINYLTGKQESYEVIDGKSSEPEISSIRKTQLLKLSKIDISEIYSIEEE